MNVKYSKRKGREMISKNISQNFLISSSFTGLNGKS